MENKITVRVYIQNKLASAEKYKHWIVLVLSFVVYAIVGLSFLDSVWLNSFLAIGGIALTVIISMVLGIENSREIATNTEKQIKAISENTERQIAAISANTEKQMRALTENTERQINCLIENTEKQINAHTENTDRQILELQKNTNHQIQEYRTETQKLVEGLKNNSELLAGILKTTLEDAIVKTDKELKQANNELWDVEGWKLLRTEKTKELQVQAKRGIVSAITNRLNYFKSEYNKVIREIFKLK